MSVPPLVLFAGTFLVWIAAKGEAGKYWALATTKKASATPAPLTPQQGGLGTPSPTNATYSVANGSSPGG